jgi:hypothetical protein
MAQNENLELKKIQNRMKIGIKEGLIDWKID